MSEGFPFPNLFEPPGFSFDLIGGPVQVNPGVAVEDMASLDAQPIQTLPGLELWIRYFRLDATTWDGVTVRLLAAKQRVKYYGNIRQPLDAFVPVSILVPVNSLLEIRVENAGPVATFISLRLRGWYNVPEFGGRR